MRFSPASAGVRPVGGHCVSIRNRDDELKIDVTPRLSRLPGLFESVENFGSDNNVPEANVYVINLIIDELIANYVTHSVGLVERPKIHVG